MPDAVEKARGSYARHAWGEAYAGLHGHRDSLVADDLELLAVSAYLVGKEQESDAAWARAHDLRAADGDREGAARCAFWLGFRLVNAHERPGANGWIARLERLTEGSPAASLPRAQLAYLTGLRALFDEGDLATATADLRRAADLAASQANAELAALARLAHGRVLILMGKVTAGLHLLDDAMLTVRSEALSPIAVGDSYCTAIDACHDLFDVQRGQDWNDGLTRWCAEQPDLVPFAGICQVHRAEFLQLQGAWVEAMAQAGLARTRLSTPLRQPLYGAAVYQEGELRRLQGELAEAEACYREASAAGRDPQPGLALLRLSQGRTADAAQAIDRAVAEAADPVTRTHLWAAYVEVMLACDRVDDARRATSQLAEVADALGSPLLDAVALRAHGSVLLAAGDPRAALGPLRRASDGFRERESPYEVARTAVLIARARRELGDEEGARLEVDAARATFARLGAGPDLARLDSRRPDRLTARELQVLRLVAAGHTNRSIGSELGLSARTVDRHLSNIFGKLGVSSRAAATALAYEAELL
ncbi:MAG: LuxR C-terminal-related transcriptional regulator [Nocardioides sp.]